VEQMNLGVEHFRDLDGGFKSHGRVRRKIDRNQDLLET
jgi:hypothetical protein